MNKLLIVGILLIIFVGVGVAGIGEGVFDEPVREDISVTVTPNTSARINQRIPIETFNNLKYELDCTKTSCKMILNKEKVFKNREINFSIEQVCLNWIKTEKCLAWNTTESIVSCYEYETVCESWTTYSKEDFVKMAIQKEIEFVASTTKTSDEKEPVFDSSSIGNIVISVSNR